MKTMTPSHKNIVTEKWLDGIAYEIAFWKNVYRWPHTFKGMMGWSHYGSKINLEGFDANDFLLKFNNPKVYDVGSGMSYAIGDRIEKQGEEIALDIHYMDPLAFHFNHILSKYKKDLPKIEFGMSEYLSSFIPNKDAALITIQNALDHSSTPIKGIVEALVSLRKGGVLYLNHHRNEAEMEKYKGFHQYNVDEKEGELIIWNKTENINVNQLLMGFASVETKRMDTGRIVAVITRNGSEDALPSSLQCYVDDKYDKAELCKVLLQFQYINTSFGKKLKDSFYAASVNIIQFFAQMLPWHIKMKLKRLIKQA